MSVNMVPSTLLSKEGFLEALNQNRTEVQALLWKLVEEESNTRDFALEVDEDLLQTAYVMAWLRGGIVWLHNHHHLCRMEVRIKMLENIAQLLQSMMNLPLEPEAEEDGHAAKEDGDA